MTEDCQLAVFGLSGQRIGVVQGMTFLKIDH